MLTPKREKFVQNLIAGMSQREAYRKAFPSAVKWKDATVDSKASELFGNDEILERYNQLQAEFAARALYTREEAVKDLRWMQDEARKDIDGNGINKANAPAFLNATKQLADLCGLNVQKVEISGVDRETSKLDDLISQIATGSDEPSADAVPSGRSGKD